MLTKKISGKGEKTKPALPDVVQTSSPQYSSLSQVGMSGVETQVKVYEDGYEMTLPARVSLTVNLIDPKMRGIHMSRIYTILFNEFTHYRLTPEKIRNVLEKSLYSQEGISSLAEIRLYFTLPLQVNSLLSGNQGIRHYPIIWEGEYKQGDSQFIFNHRFRILYSSTCPCSTALSEDLQKKSGNFTIFSATPHAQRSEADITLRYHRQPVEGFMTKIIKKVENTIKTPVQTVVKREDEQEFARLNAENLMFCEDAVRILQKDLENDDDISDYRLRVAHYESLHAHDAVASVVKGLPGGLRSEKF